MLAVDEANLDAPRQALPRSLAWIGEELYLRWSAGGLACGKLRAQSKMVENLGDRLGLGDPSDDLSMASAFWADMDVLGKTRASSFAQLMRAALDVA